MNIVITGLPGAGKTTFLGILYDYGYETHLVFTDKPVDNDRRLNLISKYIRVSKDRMSAMIAKKDYFAIVKDFKIDGEYYNFGIPKAIWQKSFLEHDTKSAIVLSYPMVWEMVYQNLINPETTLIFDIDTNASVCTKRMINRGDDMSEISRRIHYDLEACVKLYGELTDIALFDRAPVIEAMSSVFYEKFQDTDPLFSMLEFLQSEYEIGSGGIEVES